MHLRLLRLLSDLNGLASFINSVLTLLMLSLRSLTNLLLMLLLALLKTLLLALLLMLALLLSDLLSELMLPLMMRHLLSLRSLLLPQRRPKCMYLLLQHLNLPLGLCLAPLHPCLHVMQDGPEIWRRLAGITSSLELHAPLALALGFGAGAGALLMTLTLILFLGLIGIGARLRARHHGVAQPVDRRELRTPWLTGLRLILLQTGHGGGAAAGG